MKKNSKVFCLGCEWIYKGRKGGKMVLRSTSKNVNDLLVDPKFVAPIKPWKERND